MESDIKVQLGHGEILFQHEADIKRVDTQGWTTLHGLGTVGGYDGDSASITRIFLEVPGLTFKW